MPRPLSPPILIACAVTLVDKCGMPRTPAHLLDLYMNSVTPGAVSGVQGPAFRVTAGGESRAVWRPALWSRDGSRVRTVCPADWSTAFVHHAGFTSHYDVRAGNSAWPLPPARTAMQLGAFAEQHGVLADDRPQRGDVYLLWSPPKLCYTRAGIVAECFESRMLMNGATYYECLTLEGDTTPDGALHGPCTLAMRRRLSPEAGDRLVRWVDLEWSERDAGTGRRINNMVDDTRERAA